MKTAALALVALVAMVMFSPMASACDGVAPAVVGFQSSFVSSVAVQPNVNFLAVPTFSPFAFRSAVVVNPFVAVRPAVVVSPFASAVVVERHRKRPRPVVIVR